MGLALAVGLHSMVVSVGWSLKVAELCFCERPGVPWMSLSVSLLLFVSLLLALVRRFAAAIDVLRLVVSWAEARC